MAIFSYKEDLIPDYAYKRDIVKESTPNLEIVEACEDLAIIPYFKLRNAIAIAICCDQNFSDYAGVLVNSIVKNRNRLRTYDIVIFELGLSNNCCIAINSIVDGYYNIHLRFIDMGNIIENFRPNVSGNNYNESVYFRLYAPYIMRHFRKMLYLDSDTIVNTDISSLFDTNIYGYDFAAVYDLTVACWRRMDANLHSYFSKMGLDDETGYYNTGVVLFNNWEMIRRHNLRDLLQKAENGKYLLNDQDILNEVCLGKIKSLSEKWNVFVLQKHTIDMYNTWLQEGLYKDLVKARKRPGIMHYTERSFPFCINDSDMGYLYYRYARESAGYENLLKKMHSKN